MFGVFFKNLVMARVKFGAIVTDMRGKLGGHLFQKGNQSRVLKTGASPRRSISTFVQTEQARILALQNSWNAKTTAERIQWGVIAGEFPAKNVFNDQLILTGYQLFMKNGTNFLRAGFSLPLNVSAKNFEVSSISLTSFSVNTIAGTISMVLSGTASPSRIILLAQVLRRGSSKVVLKKFVRFSATTAGIVDSAPLYNTLVSRVGSITTSTPLLMGVQLVNSFGVSKGVEYVTPTIT